MAGRKSQKNKRKTNEPTQEKIEAEEVALVEPKKESKPKRGRKEKVKESPKKVEQESKSVEAEEEKPKKTRHVPTRESVEQEFDELVAFIEEEINKLRDSSLKTKGVKFLRTIGKKVKTLRTHTLRVTKQRKKAVRKNNQNSGFLKPVKISKDLAKFTGWNPDELKSRVDVTKYICKYIKENKLQNPEDGRQIVLSKDKKLRTLLGYDSKKDPQPMTYYKLQTYLKSHYIKEEKN